MAPSIAAPDRDALARSEILRECSEAELDALLADAEALALDAGALLFSDDDRAHAVWVLVDGELVVSKRVDGQEVVIDRLGPGAYLGEISLLTGSAAEHRARARTAARLVRLPEDAFYAVLRSCVAVSQTVLRTMAERVVRRIEYLLQQRERMAGLATLAAGLAHELNNPAAAAARAVAGLRERVGALAPLTQRLAQHPWTTREVELLRQLDDATREADAKAVLLDPLDRSDREEALAAALAAHGVGRAWALAPLLVVRSVTPAQLDDLARGCSADVLGDALAWAEQVADIRQLLDAAGQSTARISEMVQAIKAYSYLDTTTRRRADVHEGLEESLTMLAPKLREARVQLTRRYDRALPPLEQYGTELSQVWTNLLDNAADALAAVGGGALGVVTRAEPLPDGRDGLEVEVTDAGPGIAPEVLARVFEPFFTTKAPGRGTGLGLEIVQRIVARHGGRIGIASAPGETRVVVHLLLAQPPSAVAAPAEAAAPGIPSATAVPAPAPLERRP
jgi:signal transduction histidine kinase